MTAYAKAESASRSFRPRAVLLSIAAVLSVGLGATALARAETPPGDAPRGAAPRGSSGGSDDERSGYSYIRLVTGDATVNSRWNGKVDAKRNMPISAGDEIQVSDAARVEIGLADGNILQVGGGTRAQFESLYAQQGEDDDFSAVSVRDGSLVLSAIGRNEDRIPRIDTEDATIYVSPGGRVRVNADPRRGTSIIDRNGSVEVRTRTGSYKLRGGQYLMVHGEEEPEIARGSFSRDRFDLWSAERMDAIAESVRTVSARYVDEDYASDVESLDGYGDWNYSQTYSTYVWTPHVDITWTPYSFGSWYYTPAGLTWWSYDPWGWYPHHYGNWFFDASFNRWCWAPAAVYSPAWVYWAYSGSYVGWCPTGLYSGFGPWWNTYYRRSGWNRPNVYLALHGSFRPRDVDFRGWNFTGVNRFGGTNQRADIIRGDRIAGQLGSQVAISSRPIVARARPGEGREAIRDYIREAPRVIERASTADSARLAPILSRERNLPAASVEALRDQTVVAERGRLTGVAAGDLAPRGARVERGRVLEGGPGAPPAPLASSGEVERPAPAARVPERGRMDGPPGRDRVVDRTIPAERSSASDRAPRAEDDWRSRGRAPVSPAGPSATAGSSAGFAPAPANRGPERERIERARPDGSRTDARAEGGSSDWRTRRIAPERSADSTEPGSRDSDWRTREVPPARRVIEGAVPGRRIESRSPETRGTEPRSSEPIPRREYAPRADAPRSDYAPRRPEVSRPDPAPAPQPRMERNESRSAPPPPPPPRAESRSAPPPAPAAPSHSDRGRKD